MFGTAAASRRKKIAAPPRMGRLRFRRSAVLKSLADGRDILLMAQKSGMVFAIDPDQRGKLLWQSRIGHAAFGRIEWGGAADSRYAYFPLSDFDFDNPIVAEDCSRSTFALDGASGTRLRRSPHAAENSAAVRADGTAYFNSRRSLRRLTGWSSAPPTTLGMAPCYGTLIPHKNFTRQRSPRPRRVSKRCRPAIVSGMVY